MPQYNVSTGVLQNKKGSATWCVPSFSSGDFCFFLFRFFFDVSSKRTKSSDRSISQNRLICHHYKVSTGVLQKKKTFTGKMTTAEVVKTPVTVNNNSPIQDYVHPDDQTQPTFEMTLGFKPFTTKQKRFCNRVCTFFQLP